MTISQLLDNVIGFQPINYMQNVSGEITEYVRVFDQKYFACVLIFILITFMIFYGIMNVIRLVGSRGKK